MKKSTMKKATLAALASGLLTLSAAHAVFAAEQRREPPSATQLLADMDSNKDGKLSKSELKGPLKNDFDRVDTDNDGYLSKEELENAKPPQGGPGRN